MRILVTGAAGFIGSHVTDRLLASGHQVLGVDDLSSGSRGNLADAMRSAGGAFRFREFDVTDPGLVAVASAFRPDAVCHLAAQISVPRSVSHPVADARVNVLGTVNVLEAARGSGARHVAFASSVAVYGVPPSLPVPDDAPADPRSPYGASKRSGEIYLGMYRALHGLGSTALTLANVYGPRQSAAGEAGVVAIFTEALLRGAPTRVFGRGDQTRDYVYVGDVARAFVLTCERSQDLGAMLDTAHRLDIGTGVSTTDRELHSLVAAAAGAPDTPDYAPPRPGDLPAMVVDPTRAQKYLGWSPEVSLRDGIEATIAWARRA